MIKINLTSPQFYCKYKFEWRILNKYKKYKKKYKILYMLHDDKKHQEKIQKHIMKGPKIMQST